MCRFSNDPIKCSHGLVKVVINIPQRHPDFGMHEIRISGNLVERSEDCFLLDQVELAILKDRFGVIVGVDSVGGGGVRLGQDQTQDHYGDVGGVPKKSSQSSSLRGLFGGGGVGIASFLDLRNDMVSGDRWNLAAACWTKFLMGLLDWDRSTLSVGGGGGRVLVENFLVGGGVDCLVRREPGIEVLELGKVRV